MRGGGGGSSIEGKEVGGGPHKGRTRGDNQRNHPQSAIHSLNKKGKKFSSTHAGGKAGG